MDESIKRKGREKRNQCPRFCHQAKKLWRGRSKACWSGPCRFHHLFSPIRHYFPDCWAVNWSAAGTAHGNLTPPRIAPSCPHCLCLWLDREFWAGGIIARQLAKAAFGWKGTVRCLLWPSFMQTESAQAGFRASSALLFPFVRGPPADVISRRIFSLKGSNEAVEITPLTLFPVE